jgi:signal transduction histidine kinase/CheY-like chemotaxis protein
VSRQLPDAAGSGHTLPADLAAAVVRGGETGRRFADLDWTAHPLGSPRDWPTASRTAVAMALSSLSPMMIFLGPHDLYVVYNDASIPILGDRHLTALGASGRQVWWDVWTQVGPMIVGVVATGAAVWSDDLQVTFNYQGKPKERYFTFSFSPLIGDDGATGGVICTLSETTERVLSVRRMQLLNAVASVAMDSRTLDEAVAAVVRALAKQPADVPFVAAYISASGVSDDIALRAATPSVLPLLPTTLRELTEWNPRLRSRGETHVIDGVEAAIPGIGQALAEQAPEQALVLPIGEGGTAGALVVGVNPRCTLDGLYLDFGQLLAHQLSSVMAALVSYERQRQRADGLADLDHAKTMFLANVSHEFRTPLTLLLGPLDDALNDVGVDALLTHRLRTARQNAARLLRLVNSLLDFSRIEAGRATANLVCADVGLLTSRIASSFDELCRRAGLELIVDCDAVLADVDPAMWETIVLNLLTNAVKFTLQGAIRVQVRDHPSAPGCCVVVRDTGVGIAEADVKRLGERFFRADTAHGRTVEGAGIGLSLVRGLVKLHNGTIEIDSKLDGGTTVTVFLPASAYDTPVAAQLSGLAGNSYVTEASQWLSDSTSSPDAPATIGNHRELVLIADDNADMRDHLKRVLSPHWRTVLVSAGDSALVAARKLRPDVIVTDVMMPGMNGFELVSAIRADAELAATPVLMLSARAGADAVTEGFAGGADDYLLKPFSSQDLVDRVAARLSGAARERANSRLENAEARVTSQLAQLEGALQTSTSVAAVVAALFDSPLGSADAAAVAIGVLDAENGKVQFEYSGAVPAELRDRYHVVALDTPLVPIDVIKTGEPMIIVDTLQLPQRYGHVVHETATNVRACVSQPLRGHDGRVIGSLGLLWSTPREFEPAELDAFARTAEMTQSALERLRLMQREQRIAIDFQEHLLDLDRGSTAAVVAAVYQPAGEAMRVGGDWYLVAPVEREGRIAISVGDVVGHGLTAAVVMSRLRAAVAATAFTEADPAAVLAVLDKYTAAALPGAHCATVSYAVIDTQTDHAEARNGAGRGAAAISYTCAGHPYPLVVSPGQKPVYLEAGRRPPLGVWDNKPLRRAAEAHLPAGSLVLLYTDGLIERAGESLDDGFARLQSAAARCAELPVAHVCAELLEVMMPPDGYNDDVVVLALRPGHSTASSFAGSVPAALGNLAELRNRLRSWLATIAVDPLREPDILLATGEAVTNAIEHASDCDPHRTVAVEAFVHGDKVSATVSDSGRWSGDSSASARSYRRGRGLTLINGLADRVDTVRTARGTQMTLQFERAVRAAPGAADAGTR